LRQIVHRVITGNEQALRIENRAHLVADQIVNRLHVELRGKPLLNAVDDFQFGGALLHLPEQAARLGKQARILNRRAEVGGERAQEAHVRLAIQVRLLVLDIDDTRYLVAHNDGHAQPGFGMFPSTIVNDTDSACYLLLPGPQHEGLSRFYDFRGESHAEGHRRHLNAVTGGPHPIRKLDLVSRGVVERDENGMQLWSTNGRKDPGDFVAHQINDGLEFELLGQALPHAVDDLQFRVALACLRQQATGLVKQPRVFQRDADVERDRRQHARIRLGERVLAIHVLERNGAF